jgi:hypothetical protein
MKRRPHDQEKRGRGSAQQKWQIRALAQHRAQTLVYLRVNTEIAWTNKPHTNNPPPSDTRGLPEGRAWRGQLDFLFASLDFSTMWERSEPFTFSILAFFCPRCLSVVLWTGAPSYLRLLIIGLL